MSAAWAARAVVDFQALGERTLWLDCDVLQADGGTRCAAICGAYVSAQRALDRFGLSRAFLDSALSLLDYVRRQDESTGQVPNDRSIIVEAFQDEIGDWRDVLQELPGRIHGPSSLFRPVPQTSN